MRDTSVANGVVVAQLVFLPEFDIDRQEIVTMLSKTFTSGRIRRADYNPESQQLDLHWDNKNTLAYKHVPQEVFRRLCSAPNPTTYWEDRIAEEYPKGIPMTSSALPTGTKTLNDLFGSGD